MDKVKIGWIGLGGRGFGLLKLVLNHMDDVEIVGVCDVYEDRMEQGRDLVTEKTGKTPIAVTDYKKLLEIDEIEAIITPSAWEAHVDICVDSMLAGKYVATEVGGAYSIEDCFRLVETYEKTKVPCMILENCCYNKEELTILNMIKKGLFGEIVHCEGGYRHDLRDEVALGNINRHYRLRNYLSRNAEVYPTHELGPIAKYININRGNRMLYLVSMASKSRGVTDWIKKNKGENFENANADFALGDIVITLIKCANGETITLTHDTSLPRPNSRGNLVQGTNGIWSEDNRGILLDGTIDEPSWSHKYTSIDEYYGEHLHPLWNDYNIKDAHGGMDYHVLRAFIEAVKAKTQTPIDAYDTAAWMSITPLSEASIKGGSIPVEIPDFTNGKWQNRGPYVRSKYCLEEVCEDMF